MNSALLKIRSSKKERNAAVPPIALALALIATAFFTHLSSSAQETGTARATLNFRASPNGRDLRTNIKPGEKFQVLQSTSSWVKIRRSNGKTGWIWKKYVTVHSENKREKAAPEKIIDQATPDMGELKNVRTSLTIRSRPTTRSGDRGALRPGEKFEILGTAKNGWYKVKSASGVIGYASDNYIRQTATPTIDNEPVKTAETVPVPDSAQAFRDDEIVTNGIPVQNARIHGDVANEMNSDLVPAKTETKEGKPQTAEEARAQGVRLEALKELRDHGMDQEAATTASATAKDEDQKIEADCSTCLAQNDVDNGPTRSLLDVGSHVYAARRKERLAKPRTVPILAGNCSIGDRYGNRKHPILGFWRMHSGQDVKTNRSNQPLRSPMKGVVVASGAVSGYGYQIKITLANGVTVSYNHMQKRSKFKVGAVVEAGTVVGKSGATGLAQGIHLHLETYDANGERMDPLRLFKRSEICGSEKDPVPPKL